MSDTNYWVVDYELSSPAPFPRGSSGVHPVEGHGEQGTAFCLVGLLVLLLLFLMVRCVRILLDPYSSMPASSWTDHKEGLDRGQSEKVQNIRPCTMELVPDLWRQELWLPPGVTWDDMERLGVSARPRPQDLLLTLPLALGFVALRYLFERFCAPPMGRCLGVRDRLQVLPAPSPKLESYYKQQSRNPSQKEIVLLMSQCGKTQRQIETWFRLRRNQDRPSQTRKFGEAAWRFFFYSAAFIAGLSCLIDRPWFWDLRECWRQYPVQPMESAHFWYYMLELGFYESLLLRISVDIKRKDFKEQVIHHLATIFLLSFSYCANYIRIGTLVMLLHDSSDILLEDERSDDESEFEEDDKEEEHLEQGATCCWDRGKDSLNSKLSVLTNSCVLNNLTNHRASAADRMRKAQ
ncbi:hypothetical protein WMY93_001529 [Mugilogobius chulae]|uniref:Homeobox domain-containing protein n=1 Tax=Mugilogobius chulae TaxID=88201 RepID=A0AAW0Q2I2_9GOBI